MLDFGIWHYLTLTYDDLSSLNTYVQPFHNQTNTGTVAAVPQPPQVRPRVRARRGQATDPHSIAERVISHLWTLRIIQC